MKNSMLISIADCNHGFWEPEEEECNYLTLEKDIDINVTYQDCTQDNIVDKCAGSDIIAVQRLILNKDNIGKIPTCRVVVRLGVGIDNINIHDMEKLGVKVVYFPGFCTEEVANHALALILSSYRRLNTIQKYQTKLDNDTWGRNILMDGVKSAPNTTIGILGYGRIGTQVVKRLRICGFNVIICDPYVNSFDVKYYIKELFIQSDIVSIHCSLTDETSNMVNYNVMSCMKRGSSIVNTARGRIVNSDDLKLLLDEGHLRMAYVDVFDPEPANIEALKHDNLYITPHVSFYSLNSLDYLKREFIKQSVRTFCGM